MDKSKALDKIQKCLNLSKSSNPHEAAAAMRQAQKLMAANGLTADDVALLGYGDAAVDVPIQVNRKKTPIVLTTLLSVVMRAFGVTCVIERRVGVSDLSYRVRYFGPKTRVATAAYAHQVLYRAMEGAWRQHLKENPHLRGARAARTSFQMGWIIAVNGKVDAIGFPDEEREATKALELKTYGEQLPATVENEMKMYGSLMRSGRDAAADFSIHRPMDQEKTRLEHF